MKPLMHEELYRGEEALANLAQPLVVVCGAGAIGSNLVDNLLRQGFRRLRVIDFDRVEEHNISTQLYDVADVGARKVDILRAKLFRSVGLEIEASAKKLDDRNVKSLLKQADIVVDAFDNSQSRQRVQRHVRKVDMPCLHVGLFEDYCEVVWDDQYRVPNDVEGDVCEYPLARNLAILSAVLASETLVRYVAEGKQQSLSATLGDFAIRTLEMPVTSA